MKYPFTNAGFIDLQIQLYAMTDVELKAEAQIIQSDFINWMENNFDLSNKQVFFLENLDTRVTQLVSFLTSFAVENRRPISLHKEDPPPDDNDQGKILKPKSTLSASAGLREPFNATGQLEIHVQYIT